jgi:hypothetical protein
MISKGLAIFFLIHFGLSLAAFLGLNTAAVAAADAGADAGWLPVIELPVRYLLLQPVAHWVLANLAIAWWTWPGLVALGLVAAANSAVVCGIGLAILAVIHRRR